MNSREQIIIYVKYNNIEEFNKICLTEPPIDLWNIRDDKDSTLLHFTIMANAMSIFENLILFLQKHLSSENLIDYINYSNYQNVCAIHLASFKGNLRVIKTLIQLGANINCLNRTGLNVIHFACQGNQPNSLAYFKEYYSMDLEETDDGQGTPLHWACYSGSDKATFFLLFNGVNSNSVNKNGHTALHLAVLSRKSKIIKKLIQYGIDYKLKDNNHMTAKELAQTRDLDDIYDFLSKAEKCNPCSFTSIVKKPRCSRTNILIVIITKAFSAVCFLIVLFPCKNYHHYFIYLGIWCRFKTLCHLYVYISMTALFLLIYTYMIFSDPGVLTKKVNKTTLRELLENEVDLKKYCLKCLIENTDNSKHCILCEKCIEGFDHHCFWINNCIGKSNHKVFLFFLILSAVNSVAMIILTLISIVYSADLSFDELEGYYFIIIGIDYIYLKWTQLVVGILLLSLILFFFIELIILIRFNFRTCSKEATRTSTLGPLSSSFVKSSEINITDEEAI